MPERAKNSRSVKRNSLPERRTLAKRVAGGAAVSAALAAGALATVGVDTAKADSAPVAVTCAPADGAGCGLFGLSGTGAASRADVSALAVSSAGSSIRCSARAAC